MFNSNNGAMSPADVAAVMGGNGWNNNFGNDIWSLFLIAILFGMWGNGGWGFNNGNSNGAQAGFYATQADLQRGFDQAALANKIDNLGLSLEHDMRDPGYMVTNSFAQAELSRANNQAALMAQMNANATANMQGFNATQMAIMNGTNQEQANTAQIRYDMATSDCAIKTAISQAVQDINLNSNNNYRALHDELVADKLAAKDARIQEQAQRIAFLENAASQSEQNAYLISQLRPAAIPSYQVPNPYYGCGCGGYNGCGCNN